MANLTKDELQVTCDAAIETAIATLLTASNIIDRVGALRLLTRRVMFKNRTNRVRVRAASENPGAL